MTTILQNNPCVVRGKYNNKEYTLYKTTVKVGEDEGHREETMYFFIAPENIDEFRKCGRYTPCALPEGYTIGENKLGAPFLVDKVKVKWLW